jgi:hypothetical protein
MGLSSLYDVKTESHSSPARIAFRSSEIRMNIFFLVSEYVFYSNCHPLMPWFQVEIQIRLQLTRTPLILRLWFQMCHFNGQNSKRLARKTG